MAEFIQPKGTGGAHVVNPNYLWQFQIKERAVKVRFLTNATNRSDHDVILLTPVPWLA